MARARHRRIHASVRRRSIEHRRPRHRVRRWRPIIVLILARECALRPTRRRWREPPRNRKWRPGRESGRRKIDGIRSVERCVKERTARRGRSPRTGHHPMTWSALKLLLGWEWRRRLEARARRRRFVAPSLPTIVHVRMGPPAAGERLDISSRHRRRSCTNAASESARCESRMIIRRRPHGRSTSFQFWSPRPALRSLTGHHH